jgi:hypothetical protein
MRKVMRDNMIWVWCTIHIYPPPKGKNTQLEKTGKNDCFATIYLLLLRQKTLHFVLL